MLTNGKKIKLLIAEDEKNFSLILQKELSRRNYDVSIANDGQSAFESCQKVDYDVVVMDMMMPSMNGLQALKALKKKMQREGTFREMKRRRAYEKPSERRVREKAEAIRRHRKMLRKRLEREGY